MYLDPVSETPKKQAFKRTIGYLGASTTWSLGLGLFSVYILIFVSFLTDAVSNSNFDPRWLWVSGLAFLPPIAAAVAYRSYYLNRRPERSRPFINVLVAGLLGSIRNLSVGILGFAAGIDSVDLWWFRFAGGFFMGVTIYILWAVGNGSKIEYKSQLRALEETQGRLAATRKLMVNQLEIINEGLQDRTKAALVPQLNLIRELLSSSQGATKIIDQLRLTITDQIRPMMSEIAKQQPKPLVVQDFGRLRQVNLKLPKIFELKNKIEVNYSTLTHLIGVSFWMMFLGTPNGILDYVALTAIYWITLSLLKFMLPNGRSYSRRFALGATAIFGVSASAAASLYIYSLHYTPAQYYLLVGLSLLSGVLGPVLLLPISEIYKTRLEIEAKIRSDLYLIAKENALFAQSVWVFRKRWLLILHGTVQSALTAALTRLQNVEEADPVTVELVKQDLQRAESAINSNLREQENIMLGLDEIRKTWAGICEVKYVIYERAKRALVRSFDTQFCVNEILKEAVSNAVRHGEATEVKVAIDRIANDLLTIEVLNNGQPPKRASEGGIGSDMLNEITLHWELTTVKKDVRLFAELPVRL